MTDPIDEGWYLMSVAELERELSRWRSPSADIEPSGAQRLSIEEALTYRDRGNLPDAHGRSLRLALRAGSIEEVRSLSEKRLIYEPDFHDPPVWRREGSVPVTVVPLRPPEVRREDPGPWWEDADVAALEKEWAETGMVAGISVPGAYRGFVYKTVLALRASGKAISPTSVSDSISRWVPSEEAATIRAALTGANPRG